MRTWIHFADVGCTRCKKEILDCLDHAGICWSPPNWDYPVGAGIVVFSEAHQNLFECIRKLSHVGQERVLAIAIADADVPIEAIWQLLHAGASDVINWDNSYKPEASVKARFDRWQAVDDLIASPLIGEHLIGKSVVWRSMLRQIVEVARFTDANFLLLGESGTGKELVARLIHRLDLQRSNGKLSILDCSTIVPELSGSEFFGHERGAFTGASNLREGAFALANDGCLFLDEIGELPLPLQAQLLRVVQEGTFKRVGGNTWFKTNFRLICATNRNLAKDVNEGEFRHDLYYRIANWTFTLPPLRERPEDIPLLARYFIQQCWSGKDPPALTDAVSDYLLKRAYPGNVRDLQQIVARIMQRHTGSGTVTAGEIPKDERPSGEHNEYEWRSPSFEGAIQRALALGWRLKEIGRATEDIAIRLAVREEEGNLQRAARRLGVTDRALQLRRATERQQHGQAAKPKDNHLTEVA